jgi:uncharacterized damage-inducible protein DinB
MLIETLKILFNRDLKQLQNEIRLYDNESAIWEVKGAINNSAGNLCLHLVGNLNTYIGKELGGTAYIRNREAEFSSKNVPRDALLQQIENTVAMINQTMDNLNPSILETTYPLLVFTEKTSTAFFLAHLTTHLSYHLGQINYHRRLMANNPIK